MNDESGNDLEDSLFNGIEQAETEVDLDGHDHRYWYPTVEEIVEVHDDIIEEDPEGEPGIENPERIQFAVDYVAEGMFGEKPESVHEKAFALMRLIASNHWFVDGNKRTAPDTTNLFYLFNGYELGVRRGPPRDAQSSSRCGRTSSTGRSQPSISRPTRRPSTRRRCGRSCSWR